VFVCVFAGNAAKSKQIEIGKQKKTEKRQGQFSHIVLSRKRPFSCSGSTCKHTDCENKKSNKNRLVFIEELWPCVCVSLLFIWLFLISLFRFPFRACFAILRAYLHFYYLYNFQCKRVSSASALEFLLIPPFFLHADHLFPLCWVSIKIFINWRKRNGASITVGTSRD